MNHGPLKSLICTWVITIGLGILLAGCATVDPHPFQQYDAAMKEAGDGLDKVLIQDIDWSRDKYIENVLDGSVNLAHTAILDRKKPFTVSFPEAGGVIVKPTFYRLQDARVTLLNLNEATENYINLVGTLAGSDTLNPKTFDAMAKDTDASVNSIIKKLDAQVPGNAVRLFSVGSVEVARLIIENKRHDALVRVLTESQASIDDYCLKCLKLLMILDESLATDYSAKAMVLEGNFSKISLEKRAVDPKARSAVEHLLELNNDYLALVQALKSANNVYGALPQGHRELLKSVQKQPTEFEAIKSLYEEGKRLKSIYDEQNRTARQLQEDDLS